MVKNFALVAAMLVTACCSRELVQHPAHTVVEVRDIHIHSNIICVLFRCECTIQ